MMRMAVCVLLLMVSVIQAAATESHTLSPAADTASAAVLVEVKCKARIKTAAGLPSRPVPGSYVAAGETVYCLDGGSLDLLLANGEMKTVRKQPFQVPQTHREQSEDVQRQGNEQQKLLADLWNAIASHGKRAGTRGSRSLLVEPAPESTVRPEDFVIRWADTRPVTMAIKIWSSGSNGPVWSAAAINGREGVLVSPEARRALAAYRDNGSTERLILQLSYDSRPPEEVKFAVLSKQDDSSLQRELKLWSRENSELLRAMGRSYSFSRRGMFTAAAREYDEVVKLAPESCDLLTQAMDTYQRAAEWNQAEHLKEVLAQMPTSCSSAGQP